MVCLDVRGIRLCGAGNCVNNSKCSCFSDRFTQNSEWSFFLEDLSAADGLPCYANEKMIRFLYLLLFIFSSLVLFQYLLTFQRRKLARRTHKYLIVILLISVGLLRFIDNSRLFQQDVLFTLLIALSYGLIGYDLSRLLEKIILFELRKVEVFHNIRNERRLRLARLWFKLTGYYDLIVPPCVLFSTVFVDRSLAGRLVKAVYGVQILIALTSGTSAFFLFREFLSDLKSIVRNKTGKNNCSDDLFVLDIQNKIHRINKVWRQGNVFNFFSTLVPTCFVSSDFM